MIAEDRMNIDERHKYLRTMRRQYDSAGRKERIQLLSEMEIVTNLHLECLFDADEQFIAYRRHFTRVAVVARHTEIFGAGQL